MANQYTSTTLSGVYNDDFNEANHYHQILFNSGRALQARELTQLQSMIYAELGHFGGNIFKEGAVVEAGGQVVNASYDFVKIASTNAGGAFEDIPVGSVFKNPLTNVQAKVLEVIPADYTTYTHNTLYVQYIDGGNATLASQPTVFGDQETIYDQSGGGYELVTDIPNATGKAVKYTVGEGVFFVLGHFVKTEEQSIILKPYGNTDVDAVVGFKVVQDVVTVNDTTDLYDNAGGITNTASPGADRYRIRLVLTTQDQVDSDETFVFLANVENGKIVEEIQEVDAYNKIEEVLAQRTKEESGDYVVEPFLVHVEDITAGDSSLEMVVSPGLAYVNGHRVEKTSATKLIVPRPQETATIENDVVPCVYGNYFIADSGAGLPNLDASAVTLYDAFGGTGNALGSARIRAVEKDGSNMKVYVFDMNVDSDQSLRSVKSIGTSTSDHFSIVQEGGNTKVYGTTDNDLLFPTTYARPESFADITLVKQIHESGLTASGGAINLSTLASGQSYTDTTLWIVSSATDANVSHTVQTPTNGGRDVQITGLSNGVTYEVLAYVQKTATRKAKTLTTATATLSKVDSGDLTYYTFGVPDIFDVDSVRATNSSGEALDNFAILDNGQRDNYYDYGRIYIDGIDSAPSQLYVNYRYFARGATGDFYNVTSYTNLDTPYVDVPDHTLVDGTIVSLRDYLDFRPDRDDFGTASDVFDLPRNGTNITADVSYYLPRADKLIITQNGEMSILMGQQSQDPLYKETPNNALELYRVLLNPNTVDVTDLQVTPVEHKHYTMKDIGQLEAKVDELREFTELSLLELEQKLNAALDSDGNERIETGIQTDDLADQTASEVENPDYSASIDPESKLLRPAFDEDNIRLVIDNDLSNNVTKTGDNVYIDYTETTWAEQNQASTHVKVNPFGFVDNVGVIKLSPTSDEWKDSQNLATKAVDGSNKLSAEQAQLFNNWIWNWVGREDGQTTQTFRGGKSVLEQRAEIYRKTYLKRGGSFVKRVVKDETIRARVNGKMIDVALIPWIRSRKIYFHAKGLKPNTKFTPFFDGKDVSAWCREESAFVNFSDRTDDVGNNYITSRYTAHPDGSTDLIADENGEVIGSFFIPNSQSLYEIATIKKRRGGIFGGLRSRKRVNEFRFRAGVREFRLLDIDTNDWEVANSKAFALYTATGAVQTSQGKGTVLSTRPPVSANPYMINPYSTNELKGQLDQLTAGAIGITDPHLAGEYGTNAPGLSQAALSGIDFNGTMSRVLSDYINVDKNQFGSGSVYVSNRPANPLAQTFYVDNQFGLTLTKLSLYFRAKDTGDLPVSIHLRPVIDGKPSSTNIVPGSHVFLNPSEVTAIGTDPTIKVVQQSPTDFVFDEPLFLQPMTRYAIVVTSQSTEYEVFSAKAGERVLGFTSRFVTTSPAPGSLYLPQNGYQWIETKNHDLMFKLTRASFDKGGASLILKNANLPARLLERNPLQTFKGTKKIYVHHPMHGLEPGDTAFVDSAGDFAGITAETSINGSQTVDSADINGYTFTYSTGSAATVSLTGGGDNVLSRQNKVIHTVNPYIETIVPDNTSIDVTAKFTEGKALSSTRIGAGDRWVQDENYSRIALRVNNDFETPKAIYNYAAQEANLGAGVASTYFKIDMKTASDYVSPVVDMQRASLILVGYKVDDPDVTPHILPVDETAPVGATTGSRHIVSPVLLAQDAVGIETKVTANIPDGASIDYYYRVAVGDQDLETLPWELVEPENTIPNHNDPYFRDVTYLPGGRGGYLSSFNKAQVKFVLKGSDRFPTLKDIRTRYLGV
jgi:hypothetical protein